jgi:hypothetical protein
LPVQVTIEAKDNDPLAGAPKWGKSEAITVLPPAVGEPEALRYQALGEARNAVAAVLSAQLVNKETPTTASSRAEPAPSGLRKS